jgi:hypothetical protein
MGLSIGDGLAIFSLLAAIIVAIIKIPGKKGANGIYVREITCKARVDGIMQAFDMLRQGQEAIGKKVDELLKRG